MEELIKNLYPINASLLGEGYNTRLEYLKHLLSLDVIEIESGTQFGTWTVPEEWVVRDAWVKFNGEKIIDFKTQPLSLVVGSLPFQGKVSLEELKKHLHYSDDNPDATPFVFKYYEKDWGFCVSKNQVKAKLVKDEKCSECEPKLRAFDPEVGSVRVEGDEEVGETVDRLEEGEYEVFIDTEYRPGIMKLGVHTIPGKTDREILLFAHLDHPYQANDNLSGVACLMDVYSKIKPGTFDHTIKIVFCPETIGSIAYAYTQDISKADFMMAVDICGNDHNILLQKTWNPEDKLNRVAHCALQVVGKTYRKSKFRSVIGSDETVFNDPKLNIPGLLVTRFPYRQYHTSFDTPDLIKYDKISETADLIVKVIEIYEKDFIPVRNSIGPIMRSRYGIQSPSPQLNLNYDYLFYSMDGKRSLVELCAEFELNFEIIHEVMKKLEDDKAISRLNPCQVGLKKTCQQECSAVSCETNVPCERGEMSEDIPEGVCKFGLGENSGTSRDGGCVADSTAEGTLR